MSESFTTALLRTGAAIIFLTGLLWFIRSVETGGLGVWHQVASGVVVLVGLDAMERVR